MRLWARARVWVAFEEGGRDEEAAAERRRRIRALRWPWFSPNTPLLLGSGEEDGLAFVVVELVDGETVQDRLRREGRLQPGEAARIAADVADAVQAVHDVGLAHGEVDPAHVAITERGGVKLLDLAVRAVSGRTLAGEAERREDVRALGSLLYRMLTGAPPPGRPGPEASEAEHEAEHEAEPAAELTAGLVAGLAGEIPRGLARLCAQALADDPADRPPTAAAFASIARLDAAGTASGTAGTASGTAATASGAGWVVDLDERSVTGPDLAIDLDAEAAGRGSLREEGRSPSAHRRRRLPAALVGVAGLLVVAGVLALLVAGRERSPARRAERPPARVVSPAPAASGSRVPDLTGMTVEEARQVLLDAHLVLASVTPAPGTPGTVLRSDPPAGAPVSSDREVTLVVGVPSGRLEATPAA
jgi:PASTA domain